MSAGIEYFSKRHWDEVGVTRDLDDTACTRALARSIIEVAPCIAGCCVLDIACGTGWLARTLARHDARVAAVDLSTTVLVRGRDRSKALLSTPQYQSIDFIDADCCHLPFADDSFGVAFAAKTAWVFPDLSACLVEWKRVLAPGGRILIQLWNGEEACTLITYGTRLLAEAIPSLRVPDEALGPFDLTAEGMAYRLERSGFGRLVAADYSITFHVASASDYWKLLGSIAGTAYLAYASQDQAFRRAADRAVWAAMGGSGPNGKGEVSLAWSIVMGIAQ